MTRFVLLSDSCVFVDVGVPSLMREQVCSLQLLLGLASTIILGSESHRTHDHILLSKIWDTPNLESQVPLFIYSGTGLSSSTSRQWIMNSLQVRVKVILQQMVISACLGVEPPSEVHVQILIIDLTADSGRWISVAQWSDASRPAWDWWACAVTVFASVTTQTLR
jgi:hypothetical protein